MLLDLELARTIGAPGQELENLLVEAQSTALKARALTQQLITFADGGAPVRKAIRLAPLTEASTQAALSGSGLGCDFSLAEDLWPVSADEGQMGPGSGDHRGDDRIE